MPREHHYTYKSEIKFHSVMASLKTGLGTILCIVCAARKECCNPSVLSTTSKGVKWANGWQSTVTCQSWFRKEHGKLGSLFPPEYIQGFPFYIWLKCQQFDLFFKLLITNHTNVYILEEGDDAWILKDGQVEHNPNNTKRKIPCRCS